MGDHKRRALRIAGLLSGAVWLAGSSAGHAVPSDAQVLKDVGGNGKGIISKKLRGPGRRVWSDGYKQYVWDRSVVVVRKAGIPEFPKATVEVGGIASYYYAGAGKFSYNRFFVTYNSYNGIPAPSAAQISDLIEKDRPGFFGHTYNSIVGTPAPMRLATKPEWNWHTPNSVSFRMTTAYTRKASYTTLEKSNAVFDVRLYRDGVKKPWIKFFSSLKDETTLGTTTKEADEIAAMKTLAQVDAERGAATQMASLPNVTIPSFTSDLEAFAFLHKTLRENNPKKAEAVLRRLMGSRYRLKYSEVLFDSNGEDKIATVLKMAYGKKGVYAEQYGPDPAVSDYQTNSLSLWNADGRHISRMSLELGGGTWKDGEKVGQTYRIADIEIWTIKEGDDFERIKSLAPTTRFAPPRGARLFSALGGQVAAAKQEETKANQVAAIVWTPFTSTGGRMAINFPGAVKATEGKMNDKYPMWTAEGSDGDVKCMAVAIVYPSSLNRAQAQVAVESAVQGLAAANNAPVKRLTELMGTFGRQAQMEPNGSVLVAQVFVQRDVLYQLVLSAPAATMAKLEQRKFFGSFRALRP